MLIEECKPKEVKAVVAGQDEQSSYADGDERPL